jgi:glycosyltransferase involved in cell wall biosynthesis
MQVWLLLWVCVAVCEALLYIFSDTAFLKLKSVRVSLGTLLIVSVLLTVAGILTIDWHLWIAAALVTPYRIINVVRFIRYRLQQDRLRDVSLQTFIWLVGFQIALFLISLLIQNSPTINVVGVLASIQLLGVLVLLRSTLQTWEYSKPIVPSHHFTDKELPSVSVLIPARDETETLQRCLESVIRSDYPKLEVLVLDDCSQNRRTPEIIRSFAESGVRFIQGEEAEESWVAKNYASEQLRKEASGTLLLFASADLRFEPNTIRTMVEHMLAEHKDMLSVLPILAEDDRIRISFLQPMRYYWELCLPRRMFKRPPVLSTCWFVSAERLEQYGGFASARQSIAPETHFARKAVISDAYSFVRSNSALRVFRTKDPTSQYDTTIRIRYPQLHRRLELVAFTSLFELFFVAGPFFGVCLSFFLPHTLAFLLVWLAAALAMQIMYYYVSVETHLNTLLMAFLTAPLAILLDVYMLHVSLIRYEFGDVNWRGRNVCIPVMRVEPRKQKLLSVSADSV